MEELRTLLIQLLERLENGELSTIQQQDLLDQLREPVKPDPELMQYLFTGWFVREFVLPNNRGSSTLAQGT